MAIPSQAEVIYSEGVETRGQTSYKDKDESIVQTTNLLDNKATKVVDGKHNQKVVWCKSHPRNKFAGVAQW